MGRMTVEALTQRIEVYLKESGLTESDFGRAAINDPNLVRQLREGREPRRRTRERIAAFLDANPLTEGEAA